MIAPGGPPPSRNPGGKTRQPARRPAEPGDEGASGAAVAVAIQELPRRAGDAGRTRPVDDQTAPSYVGMLGQSIKSGQPVAGAFAAAQRRMFADPRTSHPALWAPFILFGQEELLK